MPNHVDIYKILGWKFSYSSQNTMKQFLQAPKKICIAAHSTPYVDGIVLYYALKYFGINDPNIYVSSYCITPYLHKSCISIPSIGGFIKREQTELENKPTFCRVIFPSGGTITWKTGFYTLAKVLDAKIVILGIDYRTRQVIVDSVIDTSQTFEETKQICITRLRKYEAGPFCYLLRVLFNYGCETYMFDMKTIWILRLYIIVGFVYCISVKIKYYT
jgi:hypothetical protein